MPSLLLKNIPESLHKKLKEEAKKHRRSMMQEAITILEENLYTISIKFPEPVKGQQLLTQEILMQAIKEGRA